MVVEMLNGLKKKTNLGNLIYFSLQPPRHPFIAMHRHIYAPAVGTCSALLADVLTVAASLFGLR
jgi:hypothetical protein